MYVYTDRIYSFYTDNMLPQRGDIMQSMLHYLTVILTKLRHVVQYRNANVTFEYEYIVTKGAGRMFKFNNSV